MKPSNIERFDLLVGAIFGALYEAFPLPITLSSFGFAEQLMPPGVSHLEIAELTPNQRDFFSATVIWLSSSGYLSTKTHEAVNPHTFRECTLTAKGFEVLKRMPGSLSGISIGAQLQEAAKAGLTDTVKTLAGKALSMGATMGVSAVTSLIT